MHYPYKRPLMNGLLALAVFVSGSSVASAGVDVPAFSSRPGASYTLYLDFGGFTYGGDWNGDGSPGTTPAYDIDGDPTTFNATELANIKTIVGNVAGKYAGYSINITTVDPAAGLTDAQRQAYYDNTAQLLHTVVGGTGSWNAGGGAGYSQLNTIRNSYGDPTTNNGAHTNWLFAGQDPTDLSFVAGGITHENGHGIGLFHQSSIPGGNEYSPGDSSPGNGSYSPIMGDQGSQTRNLWRIGTKSNGDIQNDVAVILSNPNMTLTDDGIGHTPMSATALTLLGSTIDSSVAQGFINSASATNPIALGVDNYTKDYFKFNTDGSEISLILHAGSQYAAVGVADAGATFDGLFNIYQSDGTFVGTSTRDASTLFYTFTSSALLAGAYYVEILNIGGYESTLEPTASYFTSGAYFLTGSGGFVANAQTAAPEPGSLALLLPIIGTVGLVLRRRNKK
jgi:hypothetical protein